jgi:hypothetical protein
MSWSKTSYLPVFFAVMAMAAARAEEKKAVAEKPAAEAAADDIAQWIKQLDADKFAERQEATKKLYAAGKAAIPALLEAAEGESVESTVRAIDLLQRLMDSDEKAVKEAAKEALEKLAQSSKADAARRARQALNPNQEPDPQLPMPGGILNLVPGNLVINGNARSVSISTSNGTKTVRVEEGGRKIQIVINANESINVKITEKKDGKEVTKKYEAKNLDELKKKSPDAYKAYEDYANDAGGAGNVLHFDGDLVIGNGRKIQLGDPNDPVGGVLNLDGGTLRLPPQLDSPFGEVGDKVAGEEIRVMTTQLNEMLQGTDKEQMTKKLSPERKKELISEIDKLNKQLNELKKQLNKNDAKAEKPHK